MYFMIDEKEFDDSQVDVVDQSNDYEDVEDSVEYDTEYSEQIEYSEDEEVEESEETQEVAEPAKTKQSKEENAAYAKMRRKAEEEAKKKFEAEKAALEEEKRRIEAERETLRQADIEKKHMQGITQDRIWQVANDMGVTEEVARQLLYYDAKDKARQEQDQIRQRMDSLKVQKVQLKDKPFFNELEKDIDDMIARDPNIDIQTAYTYLRGAKLDDLLEKQSKTAEKRTIANIQDKARRKVVTSTGDSDSTASLSELGMKAAIAMGLDPREVAQTIKKNKKDYGRR